MKIDELTKKWLQRAKYDLQTAEAMLHAKRYLYVAFLCQQSLEKILKAFVIAKGGLVSRIHHLVRLAEAADIYQQMDEQQQSFLTDMTPFAIEARYGDYKDSLSEIVNRKNAVIYFEKTGTLYKWLEKKLKTSIG